MIIGVIILVLLVVVIVLLMKKKDDGLGADYKQLEERVLSNYVLVMRRNWKRCVRLLMKN